MDYFSTVFAALEKNLPIALIALLGIAVAWLVIDRFRESSKRITELSAAIEAKNAAIDALNRARLEDNRQLIPLAEKLATVATMIVASRGGA